MYIKNEIPPSKTYMDLFEEKGYTFIRASGSSMFPFIKNNDILIVEPHKNNLKIGDVVLFETKPEEKLRFICHRIVDIEIKDKEIFYYTKGDNNTCKKNSADGPIPIEKIRSKVRSVERRDLSIDFRNPFVKRLNIFIAYLSYRSPRALSALKKSMEFFIEWLWAARKIAVHLKKRRDPFLYNAEELLLILAKKELKQKNIDEAIGIIREGLYWTRFYELTIKQGVAILIYNSLGKVGKDIQIPEFVKDKLREVYFSMLGSAARQHQESANLLKLLFRENIIVVPLKGTFLSRRIYGYIESRGASVDIDIFVKWDDREKLHKVLAENGYIFSPPGEIEEWLWQENCVSPKSQNIDILYDLRLRGTYKEAIVGLWDGVRRVTEGNGLEYYEFEQEEMLIYMSQCLITSDNGYKCLKYACDINEFLNLHSRDLDWDSVISKAKKWRLRSSLYTAVSLVNNLFNNNVPLSVINSTKPGFFKRIFIKAFFNRKVMLKENFRRRLMDKFLSYVFFELIEAGCAKEYWLVIKRVLFPPKEILLSNKSYSLKPVFVGYTLRLFRGIFNLFSIMKYEK